MYGYIYVTENLINHKKYIGRHTSKVFDTLYFGSGSDLQEDIKIYGIEHFTCKILDSINGIPTICNSLKELCDSECYYIDYYNCVQDPTYYNLVPGGNNYLVAPFKRSQQFKSTISKINRHKVAVSKNGRRTWALDGKLEEYLANGWVIGWGNKKQIKEAFSVGPGKKRIMNKDGVYKKVEESYWAELLQAGWVFGGAPRPNVQRKTGYTLSQEHRKKLSESHKGLKPSEKAIRKQAEKLRGRKRIFKAGEFKYVQPELLDSYLMEGWQEQAPMRARSTSREIVCYETQEHFMCIEAVRAKYKKAGGIHACLRRSYKATCAGYHWYLVEDIERKTLLETNIPLSTSTN